MSHLKSAAAYGQVTQATSLRSPSRATVKSSDVRVANLYLIFITEKKSSLRKLGQLDPPYQHIKRSSEYLC